MASPRRFPAPTRLLAAALALTCSSVALAGVAAADPAVPGVTPDAAKSLHTVTVTVPSPLRTAPFDTARQLQVPAGWTASVWARVGGARLAAWAPDGSLLVSDPGGGRVVALQPWSTPTAPPRQTVLVSGLHNPHGLAFDGRVLYVAEGTQIDAYGYRATGLVNRRVVLGNLPEGGHGLKNVLVGADHAVYVTVGSSGNTSAEDRTANPERAAIYRIPPNGGPATVYAHGVRNGTGLALAPDGAVWTAVNNRDQIGYPWHRDFDGDGSDDYGKVMQSYVNDHPAEEVARLSPGRDLGWPYCNPDPDVSPGVPGTAYDYHRPPFVPDVQLNPNGAALDCGSLRPIEQTLPAHSAPLGFHFVTGSALPTNWRSGAVVAVHGSWNRTPPRAPGVFFLPWNGTTLGGATAMVTGFQGPDGSRWGRPVDAVAGPDGALYVTDDQSGTVYRLAPA